MKTHSPLKTPCDYTLIWETVDYLKSKSSSVPGNQSAVFSMKDKTFKESLALAKNRGIKFFYAVEANDDWNAYNQLPSYIEEMVKAMQ